MELLKTPHIEGMEFVIEEYYPMCGWIGLGSFPTRHEAAMGVARLIAGGSMLGHTLRVEARKAK
jgi:hypothetical protein